MQLPPPEQKILDNRSHLIDRFREFLPESSVIADEARRAAYDCDGLTAYRQLPMLVLLPETVQQVSRIMRICHETGTKVVPRGAGTGLSGGALPLPDGILLGMAKFNEILNIDLDNRCVVAQPGVTNLAISQAVDADGFYYAPDPSSQIACTIGGNVAENSGGVHCLKYGLTTNNVLGLEVVLMTGETVRIGGKHLDADGYDLLGLMTGSEGLLGVITEVTVRILPKPPLARAALLGFPTIAEAGQCVADIIGAGIIPAGMELMDQAAVAATEAFCQPGYPQDAGAVLIVELDGNETEVDALIARVSEIAGKAGASSVRTSEDEQERLLFWAGRKNAFPAVGRLSPDYMCMDGTIPRHQLPIVLTEIERLSQHYGLRVVNVFHAGDGNLHPLILFDSNIPKEIEKTEAFGADILKLCVASGGVLSGEHGIGVEKRDLMGEMFTDVDLEQQQRVKCAFDPDGRLNPGKVFPKLHSCAELGKMHVHRGQLPFPDIPRF